MDTGCRACKGIHEATCHIVTDTGFQHLDLCRSCLKEAPTWAGWTTWSDDMKAQRERLLADEEKEKIPA